MATHHSKTSRAKVTDAQIVVPSWDDIWSSFNAKNKKTTIEAMNAEGWKTLQQAADDSGLSRPRMNQIANEGGLETIKKKVYYAGKTREFVFVRPKAPTYQ